LSAGLAPYRPAHQNTAMNISLESRKRETRRITLWGVAINIFLAIIKVVGGILGHSQALLADGIHSISDLISDAMVLVAAKHASTDADEDHPYGHGRFETLATVALGVLLILVAFGLAYDAVLRLDNPTDLVVPAGYTIILAAISILSKEALYQATRSVANRIRSPMLHANAWHHRSDAISSVIVLVGLGATLLGYPLFDAIAAILVALMIAKIGYDLSMQSVQELVDTALEPETVEAIKSTILSIDDVRQLHMLRSRRMGHNALVDVHIQVSPRLSVSEGHHISEAVEDTLIDRFDEINDVTVHIDPEDDEEAARCSDLPLRKEILATLRQAWAEHKIFNNIQHITLHYLDGYVTVEARMALENIASIDDIKRLQDEFKKSCKKVPYISHCELSFY
jgi:cation diffusion facilitator family transporter